MSSENVDSSQIPDSLATMTTVHELPKQAAELYNFFLQSRKETWEQNIKEDKQIRDIFYQLGKYQADQAVGKVEAFLYNKETEGDILNSVMSEKEKDEGLYTKDELRDAIRDVLAGKVPMTADEIEQMQKEEDDRVKAILAKENNKF